MNDRLNTPITIKTTDISLFDQMPYISVVLHGVQMQESYKGSKEVLLKAQRIACALNPFDIITGDYSIHAINIINADIQLKVDKYNTPNFLIFKKNKDTTLSEGVLDLKTVRLKNTTISYQNSYGNKHVTFQTESTKSSIQVYGKVYHIKSVGDALITDILINDQSYLSGILMTIESDLVYNQYQRTLDLNSSIASYQNSTFTISGKYGFEDNQLSLFVDSKETNLTTLNELIPDRYLEELKPYQYTGDVNFQLNIDGMLKKQALPPTQLVFTLKNATVSDINHSTNLSNTNLAGYYQNFPNDSMALTTITGNLNQEPFNSNITITDFKNPKLNVSFAGVITGSTLQSWIELPQIDSIHGDIALDFTLAGKLNDLENRETIPNISTSGDVSITDLNISLTDRVYSLKEMKGNFIFNNNDLAISGFSGVVRESDFELTGLIKNFLAFSMLDNQPLGIEADFYANHINLDQLLSGQGFDSDKEQSYHLSISPQLYLKLNCDIDHLQFRRFNGHQIKGDLSVQNQIVSANKIKMSTMGGIIELSGNIKAQADSIFVTSSTNLSQIHIDSLFYVFENFDQNFLVDKHLKGVVNAYIDNQASFDQSLQVNSSSIRADIRTTIIDGELNNFEPLQKLSNYLDRDKLDRLRFSELANEIHIENKTIYLPSMQVNSNVSNITIGGTHSFDQHIDYRVVAPLNNRNKVDKDAAFGSIETSQTGKTKIFLKITGTTDNYKISYDKSAVKKEIISDLKREVQQLKDAFRKKGKKKKQEVELEEEDYFDW